MSFTIDCSTCVEEKTSNCDDCLVMFLTSREPDEAVVVDAAEYAALRRLAAAGLIPPLRNDPLASVHRSRSERRSTASRHLHAVTDDDGGPQRFRDVG